MGQNFGLWLIIYHLVGDASQEQTHSVKRFSCLEKPTANNTGRNRSRSRKHLCWLFKSGTHRCSSISDLTQIPSLLACLRNHNGASSWNPRNCCEISAAAKFLHLKDRTWKLSGFVWGWAGQEDGLLQEGGKAKSPEGWSGHLWNPLRLSGDLYTWWWWNISVFDSSRYPDICCFQVSFQALAVLSTVSIIYLSVIIYLPGKLFSHNLSFFSVIIYLTVFYSPLE